jgi:2,3-bisphosphoglycerate-independent phosphoglycerate mutase
MNAGPRVLLVFLDGVGMGSPDPDTNPFLTANLPTLRGLLGETTPAHGAALNETPYGPAVAKPLDPLMGVEGLPQSGTGQTALLTGENAAAIYGRHFGPWVPVPLRPLMMERNVLTRALARGIPATFANAYPSRFIERAWTKRPGGPGLAAHGAGLLTRTEKALSRGEAVSSEFLNSAWRTRLEMPELPEITLQDAGRNLARISADFRLTFFAHYATDTAGHSRALAPAQKALERVDEFLGGLVPAMPSGTLLVLASDHGNIEDITQGHTRNPTFSLFLGPGADAMATDPTSIMDIPEAILGYLEG